MITSRKTNLYTLGGVLGKAEGKGYAVGAFSPRCTPLIRPVLRAAEEMLSPVIVQISQKELNRYIVSPAEFAEEFYKALDEEDITVPVVLHLDHTKEFSIIKEAIDAGFTSVMIDASEKSFEDNIAITKEVVRYAHAKGVSVEGELGRIGTTDFVETDEDIELYTDPQEARIFVEETGVDALAISVGTAHGVYRVRQPKIDYDRVKTVKSQIKAYIVLHGGSGVPADMIHKAIQLPGGGISKVNIATDLEVAMLDALGRNQYMLNSELKALDDEQLMLAQRAVQNVVIDKIKKFVLSSGCAQGGR